MPRVTSRFHRDGTAKIVSPDARRANGALANLIHDNMSEPKWIIRPVVTFEQEFYGKQSWRLYPLPGDITTGDWKMDVDRVVCNSMTPLPNVPIRAKDTFLAQMAKAGFIGHPRFTEEWIKDNGVYEDWLYQNERRNRRDGIPHPEPRRRDTRFGILVKQSPKLIGKLVSVEIEYYPHDTDDDFLPAQNALTHVGTDGSLDDEGREIRRISWNSTRGRLEGLINMQLDGKVNADCGLHVHVDARHLGRTGLRTPEDTYDRCTKLYPFLKKLVPRSRLSNNYCRFVNNRPGSLSFEDVGRYAAINWEAYEEHGSFEFRCQGPSINLHKIEMWAQLCQHLVNWMSLQHMTVPSTWESFVDGIPEPHRTWAILRRNKLYGRAVLGAINERILTSVCDPT